MRTANRRPQRFSLSTTVRPGVVALALLLPAAIRAACDPPSRDASQASGSKPRALKTDCTSTTGSALAPKNRTGRASSIT